MIKKMTRFSYFLILLLCLMHNFVQAQVDNSSASSPIVLNTNLCDAYFSTQANVIDVTWWYNDPINYPNESTNAYNQISSTLLPNSSVNYSPSTPTRIDFSFLESGAAPLRGKLIRLRRALWQGGATPVFDYQYYVYPYNPVLNVSTCAGKIKVTDGSGNYAGLTRIFELSKDGILVQTVSQAANTFEFNSQPAGNYTVKIRILTSQGRPSSNSTEFFSTQNVTLSNLPTLSSDKSSVCLGQGALLQASGGTSYSWSSGQTTSQINVTPSSTTTYTVTITSSATCQTPKSVTISVNALPVANAGVDKTISYGASVSLTASASGGSPGYGYIWSNGAVSATTSVSPSTTTTYTVTVTDIKNCQGTDQAVVTVLSPPPVVNAGTDQSICQGLQGYVQLSAGVTSGGQAPFTYQWSHGVTGNTTNVNPASTTTYTVTVTDALGQTGTDQVVVIVNSLPTANAGPDKTTCIGGSVEITGNATGGTSPYTFQWNTGNNSASTVVTPSQTSTTYTVTATDSRGCTSTDQIVVTTTSPTVNAGSDRVIDAGQSVTLIASVSGGTAPLSYIWSNGSTNSSISVSPASTTTYTVQVTDVNGCSHNDNVMVTVRPDPIANAGTDKTICAGSSTTLSVSVVGGLSPYTYAWSNGANTSTTSVNPTTTTTYTVTVTDNNNKTSTDQVVVVVNALPNASILSNNGPLCSGSSATFTVTGTVGAVLTYNINSGTNQTLNLNGSSQTITVPNATANQILTLVSVATTGSPVCTSTLSASSTVTINPLPSASILSNNGPVCSGSTASFTVTGTAGAVLTYKINNGTNQTLNLTGSGQTITISNATANQTLTLVSVATTGTPVCSASLSSSSTVTVNPLPVASISSNNGPLCSGSTATFNVSGTAGSILTFKINNGADQTLNLTGSSQTITIPNATANQTLTLISVATTGTPVCSASLSSSSTVTITPLPAASISSNNGPLCSGSTATFNVTGTAGAVLTYKINNGTNQTLNLTGSSQAITVPNATANQTLTLVSVATTGTPVCSSSLSSSSTVTINPLPIASISGNNGPLCSGSSATFTITGTAGSVLTYKINNGADQTLNLTGSSQTITVANATANQTLTLISVATTGSPVCSASLNATSMVTVNPNPIANAGPNQSICPEPTSNLASTQLQGSASGGTAPYTYAWNNLGGNTATTGIVIASSTTYTLTVTDSKACTATSQVVITVNPKPSVNAGADQTICPTLSAALTATVSGGSSPYQFAWSNGASSSTQSVSPTETTTYSLSVTDNNNCSATDQVIIQVTALEFNIDGPAAVCAGESISLSPTTNGTYAWSTGASTASISVSPVLTTTYTLTLTANGCSLAKSKTVTVNALPTFTLPTLLSACMGSATVLEAQGLNPATGISYQWTVPAGVTNPGNVGTLTTDKAGQYHLKITNTATGCNHIKITTLKQIPRPSLYDPSLTIACGSNGTQTLKLLMKATAAAPLSPEETSPALLYLYRVLGSSIWQNSNALEINLPAGAAQTYEVSVMYQSGLCSTDLPIKSIEVPASPLNLPNLNLTSANATDCYTSNGSITVTTTVSASPFLEYALRNNQNVMIRTWQDAKVFDRLIPGDYSVEVRLNTQKINLNSCATTLGKVKAYALGVGSNALPSIQDLVKTHLSSCVTDNGAVEIKAAYLGHQLQFKVDNQAWQDSPVFPGLAKDGHMASVRPANGCPNLVVSQAFTLNPAPLPAPITVQNTPPVHCSQPNGSISISLPTELQTKDWLVSIDGGGTYIKNQWNWSNLDRGNYLVSVAALDQSCRQDYAQPIFFDPPCEEICGDGLDNDLDGKVDCADEFCQASYVMEISGKSFCRDDAKVIFTNLINVDKIHKVGGEWGTQTAFLNLPAGPVAFEIRSTAGCIQREQYTFAAPRPLREPTPDFYVNCHATLPGVLIFTKGPDYWVGYRKLGGAWVWSGDDGEVVFQNLEPGTYEVAASEGGEGSCMTISSKKIDIFPASAPVLQSLEQYAPNTCSTNDGRIVILAKGYNVEYAIRPQGSNATLVWTKSNEFNQLAAGTYEVLARHTGLDERFCETFNQIFTQTVILSVPTLTIALVNTQGPTNACINDPTLNGSITITATKPSGSTGKLVYSIDGGLNFVSNPVFTGLGPGNYTPAVAFEDHTCKTTGTVVTMTAVQAPAITSVTTTAPTACAQQGGKITINTAAVGSWQYSIDGGTTFQTSKDFLNLKTLYNYNIVVATNDLNCRNNYGAVQIPKKADCVENCTDGIDNDGNGLTDCDDPNCSSSADCPAGVDRIVCPGSTITIGQSTPANPAYCYTWVPTTGLATPHQPSTTITPTQSGQYELIITDGNGQIIKRDKVNIVVDVLSPITITRSAPAYCGKPLTLSAPAGFTTYTWKDASNNTLGTTASVQVNQAGAYTLTATKSAGCQTSGNITVSNLALSIATIGASTLCPGALVELRAETPVISGVDLAYRWSNGATTSAISAGAGAYTLTLTEVKAGCQLTAAQTLNEVPMPQLIVSADKPAVCQGQTTQLRAELSTYDNIQSYSWTGPAGFSATGREVASPELNATTAGEYQLTVLFTNGCSLSKSLTLTHLVPRAATVCNNGPICPGTELKLSASFGYTYQWTGPNGFVSSEQNPVLSSGAIGAYNVTLTDSNGCVSTHTTEVNQVPGSN